MKKKRGFWVKRLLLLLLGLLVLGGCGAAKSDVAENAEESAEPDGTPEVFQGGSLTLSVDYGYDKYVKSGRYMRIMADITNSGENFSGNLQVIIPGQSQKKYMYQKEVSLAAGETKRLEMAVPVGSAASRYDFVLTDEEENTVAQKSVKAYVSREDDFFTGILTDDTQGMAYLSGNQMKTFYLDADSFPEDVLGLDSLDIIIINDFNTDTLNEKQYEALKEFVMQGGTLVLGTGSTGVKTMAVFNDSFLTGTMGELTRKKTAFGLNEERLLEIKNQLLEEALEKQAEEKAKEEEEKAQKEQAEEIISETAADTVSDFAGQLLPETDSINRLQLNLVEKDILDLHLEGASVLVKEDGVVLLEGLYRGQGRVLLSTMDLGLDASLRNTIGMEIASQIADNVSASRIAKINQEVQGNDYSYLQHLAADLVDESRIPTVGKYVVILLIYILLIGPPLYFVLKKLDKRNLTWVIIPMLSVLFGSFIYGIGGTTRQDSPYIGFMTVNTIENGTANNDTFFSVTAPYNDDYDLSFAGTQHIVPEIETDIYYSSTTFAENSDYNIAVKYGGDTTEVKIRDYPAFEPAYFKTTSSEAAAGGLKSTLDFTDFAVTGELTNHLGYDLKQAVLYAYGIVYPIGDLEQGQTVSLTGKTGYQLLNQNDIYSYDGFLTRLSGGNPYGSQKEQTAEQVRWYYAYEYGLTKLLGSAVPGCYLMGFSGNAQNVFLEETGLDVKGVNMTMAAADINLNRDGVTYLPRLEAYVKSMEGSYNAQEHFIYSENFRMELQFGSSDSITELIYSKELNREFDQNLSTSNGFYGEIKAYNYTTGVYDVLFTSGTAGSIPAADYLDEDNRMQLLIEPDAARLENYGQVSIPVLSAVKEEQ